MIRESVIVAASPACGHRGLVRGNNWVQGLGGMPQLKSRTELQAKMPTALLNSAENVVSL